MPRATPDIPNASMADIAFLLLVFFLVTTTVANDRGLQIQLPPPPEALPPDMDIKIQERNLFKIQVNSFDNVLVEGNPFTGTPEDLSEMIREFVLNNGADPNSSDSPEKAIVSYKTDRGTSHKKFIEILDAAQQAYYQIYADNAGVSVKRWLELSSDLMDPENRRLYDIGRGKRPDGTPEYPMNLSIAEPTKAGGN
ncbi:MAG: biopolymer transporter ExbD [Cyclobacteriaceae bacterium]|nr:MAG: biopolymer transporter ExbD [Cyclobacteriaceae bacterium]